MLFNSFHFLVFLPIVLCINFLLPVKFRNLWLLVCSYYFYMSWNLKYVWLILSVTVVTYFCGRLIKKQGGPKKAFLLLGICSPLALLFYFKYFNFFLSIVNNTLLSNTGGPIQLWDIVLPVGISFYTFQAIGYVIDVYRGDSDAEKNIINYALFISFFPQLVAGPIERSYDLMDQINCERRFGFEGFRKGCLVIIWGYFLKLVIADRAAIFVDTVYGCEGNLGGWYLIIATILFSIQIYCDFYGYSSIAAGVAGILGIELMENFKAPYLAASTVDFWRRWHISLTTWFKDYLYITLGGNRKGSIRRTANRIFVFLMSGLWHGADFSYVIWGGWSVFCQIIEELTQGVRHRIALLLGVDVAAFSHRLLKTIVTFVLIDFGWIFFRAENMKHAVNVIKSILSADNFWIIFDDEILKGGLERADFIVLIAGVAILLLCDVCKERNIIVHEWILQQNAWFRCVVVSAAITAVVIFGIWGPSYSPQNFIYFQF